MADKIRLGLDIIPEMFRRLLSTLYEAKHDNDRLGHFIYYIERHIELDGDSHGPKGRELLENLVDNSPDRSGRALRAACSSIKARIELWDGTLSKLRNNQGVQRSVETCRANEPMQETALPESRQARG